MLRAFFAAITFVMAANSYAQSYTMRYDSLSASDSLTIPMSVNEIVFFELDSQTSGVHNYVDSTLSIGFPFNFMGVPFDSIRTLNSLSGIAFGSVTFSSYPHISTLGQFTKPSNVSVSDVGFYRTDTSLVIFYRGLNYRDICENINESNSFSAAIEISSSNNIYVTVYNPIIIGCDDYFPGQGFLLDGFLPVGPITSINLLNDPRGSMIECGLTKRSEHNSSIELTCTDSYAGWLYGIDQSFKITFSNTVSSTGSGPGVDQNDVSWSIENGFIKVKILGQEQIPFTVYRMTGERVSSRSLEFDTYEISHGFYIIKAIHEGSSHSWKVFLH